MEKEIMEHKFQAGEYEVSIKINLIEDPYLLASEMMFKLELNFGHKDPYWTDENIAKLAGWRVGAHVHQLCLNTNDMQIESEILFAVEPWKLFHDTIAESKERQRWMNHEKIFNSVTQRLQKKVTS